MQLRVESARLPRPAADVHEAVLLAPWLLVVAPGDGFVGLDVAEVSQEVLELIPARVVFMADQVEACAPALTHSGPNLYPGPVERRVAIEDAMDCVAVFQFLLAQFNLPLKVVAAARGRVAANQVLRGHDSLASAVTAAHEPCLLVCSGWVNVNTRHKQPPIALAHVALWLEARKAVGGLQLGHAGLA